MPGGPGFVEALLRVWDQGNAAAPLDQRLPPAAARRQLEELRPRFVVGRDGQSTSLDDSVPSEPGDALVLCTSGSSGAPKGVVLTHDAVEASALATSSRLGVDVGTDRWLACLPLAHIGGLSVVTRALITGTPLDVHDGFDAAAVEASAERGVTLVSLVATALSRIDPRGFRAVLLGGASAPDDLPGNVVVTYGMTETGSGIVYDGLPLEGAEVRIGDGELGAEGEVLVKGAMLLRCYRDGSDPKIAGGWLRSGDGGRIDAQGRVSVSGRMADVIVTGGEKVWPISVEGLVARDPSVAEVAVAGEPDPEWGERVVAYVVAEDGRAPPRLEALRERVKAELGPWAAPRELRLLETLPRTANGKIARAQLGLERPSSRPSSRPSPPPAT